MAMGTSIPCKLCGGLLTLDCGDVVSSEHTPPSLDLLLSCENCEAPTLNAFIALEEFTPVE